MPSSKSKESTEMYLETILTESLRRPHVHSIDIANAMGFSKPSVSVAMKNLKESGFVTIDGDSHIRLTAEGRRLAESVYERHLALSKLFESLGVPQALAEADACRVEHFISDETFRAIQRHAKTHGLI